MTKCRIKNEDEQRIVKEIKVKNTKTKKKTVKAVKPAKVKAQKPAPAPKAAPEPRLQIKVSAKLMLMVSKFVSKESTRYYLNGVHIEKHPKGGVVLCATDGHRLGSIHDKDGYIKGAESAIIAVSPEMLNALRKPKAKDFHQIGNISHVMWATVHGEDVSEIGAGHLFSQWNKPIDGTFPDWRRVLPKEFVSTKSICFNQKYVRDFVDVLGKECGVTAFFTGESNPTVFRSSKYPDFIGVLMPMRSGVSEPFPEWYEAK